MPKKNGIEEVVDEVNIFGMENDEEAHFSKKMRKIDSDGGGGDDVPFVTAIADIQTSASSVMGD